MAIEDKPSLTKQDYAVVFAMFVTIFTGFLMVLKPPFWLGVVLMFLSCAGVVATVFTVIRAQQQYRIAMEAASSEQKRRNITASIATATQQKNLAALLLVVMPIFPIIYFLSAGKLISDDWQYSVTMIVSMAAKLVFASMAAEGHIKATEGTLVALEEDAGEARDAEAFAEHLFHKVSLPLNSVIVGLQVLSQRKEKRDPEEIRTLEALRESTTYISQSLNELVNTDKKKIRSEDALHLNSAPFVVNDLLMRVIVPSQKKLAKKMINCKMTLDPSVPKSVVGDRPRLEYVLTTMLESALEVAPARSKMTLEVTSAQVGTDGSTTDKHIIVTRFELTRKAPFTDEEKAVFEKNAPTVKLETEGRVDETKRGLNLCRSVVTLHGGSMVCRPPNEKGFATFGFTIPFEIPAPKKDMTMSVQESRPRGEESKYTVESFS